LFTLLVLISFVHDARSISLSVDQFNSINCSINRWINQSVAGSAGFFSNTPDDELAEAEVNQTKPNQTQAPPPPRLSRMPWRSERTYQAAKAAAKAPSSSRMSLLPFGNGRLMYPRDDADMKYKWCIVANYETWEKANEGWHLGGNCEKSTSYMFKQKTASKELQS
jgi:hypothetical protein